MMWAEGMWEVRQPGQGARARVTGLWSLWQCHTPNPRLALVQERLLQMGSILLAASLAACDWPGGDVCDSLAGERWQAPEALGQGRLQPCVQDGWGGWGGLYQRRKAFGGVTCEAPPARQVGDTFDNVIVLPM